MPNPNNANRRSVNANKTVVKAMILAAGRGKRLRPITDSIPKPLVPVCGKSLIEYHLEKLAKAGVQEVVINHAWLGQKIEQQLGDGSQWGLNIQYSQEPEGGLETAGGIINALPLLGAKPFIVINGDVYCDFDFEPLVKQAEVMASQAEIQAHLLMVPKAAHTPKGDFGLDENTKVLSEGPFTFAGLSILDPALFAGMKVDFIGLAPILRDAMQKGLVTGRVEKGLWSDVGTLERLQQTEELIKSAP